MIKKSPWNRHLNDPELKEKGEGVTCRKFLFYSILNEMRGLGIIGAMRRGGNKEAWSKGKGRGLSCPILKKKEIEETLKRETGFTEESNRPTHASR